MSRGRKVALGGLGLLLIVLVIAAATWPRYIRYAAYVRAQIVAQLSRQLGGDVRFQTLHVSVLPLPHVSLDQVSLSLPGSVEGTVESIAIYPKLLPLLRGNVRVAELRLVGADLRIRLPPPTGTEEPPGGGRSVAQVKNTVAAALGAASAVAVSQAPGLAVLLKNGRIRLSAGSGRELRFAEVGARFDLPPDQFRLAITCTSSLWERMSLRASLEPTTVEGSARIDVTRLRPQLFVAQLLPHDARLTDSEMDLGVDITAHGLDQVQADVDAAIPALTIRHGRRAATLRGQHLNATLRLTGDVTHATVTRLQLDKPHLRLSAGLSLAPGAAALEVQAAELDVGALRRTAALAAEAAPVVGDVFNVLRGGAVPHITFRSAGASLGDLGNDKAFVIQGRLVDGRVHVPGVDLDLDHVTGNAMVSGGVLAGEEISAALGRSQASAGQLRLGLRGKAPELHVDTQVQADGAELAALLRRVVKNDALRRELDRVTDVAGSGSGKLLIVGTTRDAAVTADAPAFTISGRVQGAPLPLQVEGGRFVYDRGAIEASDLRVTVGASVLSRCGIRLSRNGAAAFEVSAGTSRLVLDEAYPWLMASGWLPDSSWNPQSLSGTLTVDSLNASGPAAAPGDWRFRLTGSVRALAVESARVRERIAFRYPLSLSAFRLQHDPKTGISFAAGVTARKGITGTVDLVWKPPRLEIKHLRLKDAQTDVAGALVATPQELSLTFRGTLHQATLDGLIDNIPLARSLSGDARALIRLDQPAGSTLEGHLEGEDLVVPLRDRRMKVGRIAVDAAQGTARVDGTLDAGWGSLMRLQGQVNQSPHGLIADLDLAGGPLVWDQIEPWLQRGGAADRPRAAGSWEQWLQGTLRIAAESFTYGDFTWRPAHAALTLAPDGLTVEVTDATVCGSIATPGTIAVAPDGLTLVFSPTANDQKLDGLLACLGIQKQFITGQYSLAANITASGQAAELGRSFDGHAEFSAWNGRIYGAGVTAKVLSVLNVATGAFENLADLAEGGLPYNKVTMRGDLKGASFVLTEAALNGPSVTWAAEGSVNAVSRALDLTLLVAPLKTVDSVVSRIPIISGILGGSLVSIPVKVTGSLDDPQVTPLPPSAVGRGLLGVMKRTLKLPITVIQPLLPDAQKRK